MGILDIVFPQKCAGCGRGGTYFCLSCVVAAKLHFPQVCPVCEKNSAAGITHPACKRKYSPDGLVAIWAYEGAPKKLISKLKYKFVLELAQEFADVVAKVLQEEGLLGGKKWIVVPVPLHWTRKNWRGFNHAEEIIKRVAGVMGWQVESLLVRSKMTSPQVGLKADRRKENVKGVFRMAKGDRYPDVLLFDDVWTTGATMLEATKVLKKAGFAKVWCMTLAR